MKNKVITSRIFKPTALVAVLIACTFFTQGIPSAQAATIEELVEKTESLEQQLNSANKNAEHFHGKAETLREAIADIDADIAQTQTRIILLDGRIELLDKKLKRAERELERQKDLLRASMRALYVRGDANAVELLIASENFSEFMDEQEYLDRLKGAIHESANRVVQLKQQIQAEKDEQEELRQVQVATKRQLDSRRAERARILAETQGQEARYRAMSKAIEQEQAKIEEELMRRRQNPVSQGWVDAGGRHMIGRVGSTGMSYSPHLHFVLYNSAGWPIDSYNGGTSLGYGLSWPVPGAQGPQLGSPSDYGCQTRNQYSRACPDGGWLHAGIDIGAPAGTPIYPAKSGDIIYSGWAGALGYYVEIKHADGTSTGYAHMLPN